MDPPGFGTANDGSGVFSLQQLCDQVTHNGVVHLKADIGDHSVNIRTVWRFVTVLVVVGVEIFHLRVTFYVSTQVPCVGAPADTSAGRGGLQLETLVRLCARVA